jgi:uncharacterized protein
MRIGLVSDTHVPAATYEMPYQVARAFAGVDMIMHAGDIYAPTVIDWLHEIAPVYVVPGDGVDYLMANDPRMAQRHIVEVEGVRIGLVHALILPEMYSEVWPGAIADRFPQHLSVRESVHKALKSPVDVVVFGDTHYDMSEWHDGVLLINPGSPTLPRQMRQLGTVGLLELENGRVEGCIVDLNDFSEPGRPNARYI